jgi:Transposase DDE domain group 1
VIRQALAQLPAHRPGHRPGRKVLIRTDGAGGTKALIEWLTGRRLSYSVGFTLPANTPDLLAKIPDQAWSPAYDAHDQVRDGAWVAELTGLMDLDAWPAGMRVIVGKERPHPGAQLRFDDVDGMRITAFVTNTTRGQLPDLELRHRRRARCEDRIRIAKETGLRNLPLHGYAANQMVRHRDTGHRPARLDGHARPDRPRRAPVGAETAAPPPVHHPGHARPNSPPDPPGHVRPGPLGQRCRRRDHPTRPPHSLARLITRPPTLPTRPAPPGTVEPRTP